MSATRSSSLSPLQQALVALEAMQRKLNAAEATLRGPIAVVGMACRFPGGANDPERYWQMLDAGRDGLSEVPPDRWDIDAVYDPDPAAAGRMITRRGGFLKDVAVDQFDAAFFGISQREANSMDPQQRLLLEVAWDALDNAGLAAERLRETRTGIFVGAMNADYQQLEPTGTPDTYAGPGNEFSFLAGRLAYLLGVRGPNIVVTTACSSSLVALHLACQSLRLGESDTAFVGGVNLMLSPGVFIGSSRLGALAPDGRCKTFDQAADGYARGEGCAMLVLKRLADAERNRDAILAVVRGSAVNHNGASGGLTVPSSAAQQALVMDALAASGLTPADIHCVEAHGTGTSLGDLIEVQALAGVFGSGPARKHKLRLGSVKANLGHLEAASGIAAVIKVILALGHGRWPGQVHFETPNPRIPWNDIPIEVSARSTPWPSEDINPRRAGVSSFGLSGINSHVVIEEAPSRPAMATTTSEVGAVVLPLSARDPAALMEIARSVHDRLAAVDTPSGVRDFCHTTALRRSHHDHRLAVSGRTARELADRLAAHLSGTQPEGVASGTVPIERQRIVFVFPGQGGQWPGMAQALLEEPAFLAAIVAVDAALRPHLGWSVESALRDADPARFERIEAVQPLLFAYQVALAAMWREFGLTPDAVIGHSFGEVAAAAVAGALDWNQAAALICHRSRLLARASGSGAMALVELPWEQARAAIAGRDGLSAAVCNGPRTTVLSGDPHAIDRLLTELAARDVFCRRVKVDVAAHSSQMDPLAGLLAEEIAELVPRANTVAFHSTVTGGLLDGTRLDAAYWSRNMREPVQFWPALRGLIEAGPTMFLELGPHPVLCPAIESALHHLHRQGSAVPSAERDAEALALRTAIGRLYVNGAPLRWEKIAPQGEFVPAIAYPWQRRRAWWTGARSTRSAAITATSSGRVPAPFVRLPDLAHLPGQHFWQAEGDAVRREFAEAMTIPRTRFETLALAAAADSLGKDAHRVEDLSIDGPLSPSTHRLQMILASASDGSSRVTMYGAGREDAEWKHHAAVTLRRAAPIDEWVYEVAWHPCDVTHVRGAEWGPTLVLADERGVGAALVDKLHARRAEAILVLPGRALPQDKRTADRRGDAAGSRPRIIDLRGLDARSDQPDAAADALRVVLQSALVDQPSARVWVVTCGAQGTMSTRAPEQAALWGLGRVFALEHPDQWGGVMDLAPAPEAQQADALLHALDTVDDDQIAWLDGRWHAARLVRAPLPAVAVTPWRADATYLVTGGLGGLGLALLRRMVAGGARHIVVVGRTPLPTRSTWAEQRTDSRIAALLELEELGATIESVVANVADEAAMANVFATLENRPFPVRGIFHLAGTSTFAPLEHLDSAALEAVLAPKVRGALVLEALARNVPLDYFVLFSSAAGVWGAAGQPHYAAANAFLDALARRRRAAGLPGLSVAWGRVAGGGMGSTETEAFLDRLGLAPMPSGDAFAILEALMVAGVSDRVVAAVDWTRFKPIYNSRRHAPLLDRIDVAEAPPPIDDAKNGAAHRRITVAPPIEQREILRDVVAGVVVAVLGIDPPTSLDPDLGFFRQGMDSIMAIQLRREIERALGLPLVPTLAFEYPSVSQLSEHLASVLGLASQAAEAPSLSARLPGDIDVDAIERMSDAEAEALLLVQLDQGATS